jgi:hypothetical protein
VLSGTLRLTASDSVAVRCAPVPRPDTASPIVRDLAGNVLVMQRCSRPPLASASNGVFTRGCDSRSSDVRSTRSENAVHLRGLNVAKNGKRLGFLPDWRIFTYVILIVNALFLIWIIAGASSDNDTTAKNCGSLDVKTCNDAQNVGKGIGVTIIIVLWVIVDIILLVLWLITNRKKRDCPVCGNSVKKGQMTCKNCGHDFRQQYAPQGYQQGPPLQGDPGQHQQMPRYQASTGQQPPGYPTPSANPPPDQRRPGPHPR